MEFVIRIKVPDSLDGICVWLVLLYRRIRYGCPFRQIPLTRGKFAIVDPDDFSWLSNFKWCADKNNDHCYAVRTINTGPRRSKTISMHRKIAKPPAGFWVDHINGNTLDNRRANLRPATPLQNSFNRRKLRTKTSSRFVGVYFVKSTGRWGAHIDYQRNRLWLGIFNNETDAAKAYNEAALKYHKEFACLNFP